MIFTNELNKDSVQKVGNDPTLSSNSTDNNDGDPEFEVTAEMLVHEEDNERTLEEEESFNDVDHATEIAELQKESELPIEDLFAMYYGGGDESQKENMPDSTDTVMQDGLLSTQDGQKNKNENGQSGMKRTHEEMEKGIWRGEDGTEDDEHRPERMRMDINVSSDDYMRDSNGDDFDPFFNQRITRGLAALNSQYFDEEYSTDEEYQPTIDNWKKDVQIGDDFQAEVDEGISHYTIGERDDDGDKLLWKPDVVSQTQLQTFLEIAYKLGDMNTQTPERDDEQVLYTLLQTHKVDGALRRRQQQVQRRSDVTLWSEEECQNFEQGLRVFGKDFRLIQRNKVKSRSVGEIVQFYYLWKKTERHDAFVMQTKFGRKKYTLPGIADVMGRFMEENESVFSSRSTSPNFEHTHDNQTSNSTNGDVFLKEGGEDTTDKHERNNRELNYPIFGKEKDSYFDNDFNVNYKGTAKNAGWRRTSPVSVVSTN